MQKIDELNPRVKIIISVICLTATIILFILAHTGAFESKSDPVTIEDSDIKKLYSYVHNAHYFETLDANGVLTPVDGLFNKGKVKVSDLDENYKMSMVFALFENKDRISKNSFNEIYRTIFGEEPKETSFDSYAMLSIGKVTLQSNYYVFENKTPVTDAPLGYGYVLVDVKSNGNTITLYEAYYLNNEIDALGNENFTTYEYYGKDEKCVFAYKVTDKDFDPVKAIIATADKFEQHKITFKKDKDGEYHLESVEQVK